MCVVPDQPTCIKTNACPQMTEEYLLWIQVWHQESISWTLWVDLPATIERKWFVGAAREWKWAEGLKTFFHWTFLQDECGLSSQAIEVSGSDPAFCRKVWTNSGGRWVQTLMPQLAYLQGKGWLLHSFKTATSTQIAIHDFTLKFCNSFCKASYCPGGLTGDSSRINPTAAPFQTLTNRSTARLLNPNFT